jgi:hypothetical protein
MGLAETICMRVGEQDKIDFSDFVGALNNFLGLLKDVDSAVAKRKSGNLHWRVTSLRKDPIPIVGVTPFQRRTVEDISSKVERQVLTNIDSLTANGERNNFFSDSALSRVERIAKTTPRIGASVIYIDTQEEVKFSTTIHQQTLAHVRDLTDVKSRSFGTVCGVLGSISIRNGNEFRVWDEDTGRPVRCNFARNEEARIKELLRSRVMVTGTINANRYGLPLNVNPIESINLSTMGDLPTIEEMAGLVPDFTGGLSLKQFFEEMD